MSVQSEITRIKSEVGTQADLITQLTKALGKSIVDNTTDSPIEYNTIALEALLVSIQSLYAKARRVQVTLPASGWIESDVDYLEDSDLEDVLDGDGSQINSNPTHVKLYTQEISADVTTNDHPFVQCILSDDYLTACIEMANFDHIYKVETHEGYVTVTAKSDIGLCKPPKIDLTLSLIIVDDIVEANLNHILSMDTVTRTVVLPAANWVLEDRTYKQSVPVSLSTDHIVFVNGLFNIEADDNTNEIQQFRRITDIKVSDGQITAVCHNIEATEPPNVDLTLVLKLFEVKE